MIKNITAFGLASAVVNARQLRIPIPAFIAIVYYLESRRNCPVSNALFYAYCKTLDPEVQRRLQGRYSSVLSSLPGPPTTTRRNLQNGALFQLVMLAYSQFAYEVDNTLPSPIGVESERNVYLLLKGKGRPFRFGRHVDVVLSISHTSSTESSESSESSGSKDEIWLEIKSLIGKSMDAGKWDVRNEALYGGEKKYKAHRGFVLDCAAFMDEKTGNSSFEWWLHDFDAKGLTGAGPNSTQLSKYNRQLHIFPDGVSNETFGNSTDICNEPGSRTDAKLFSFKKDLLALGFLDLFEDSPMKDLLTFL